MPFLKMNLKKLQFDATLQILNFNSIIQIYLQFKIITSFNSRPSGMYYKKAMAMFMIVLWPSIHVAIFFGDPLGVILYQSDILLILSQNI